jgi:phage protein D
MLSDANVYLDGARLSGEARGALSGVRVYQTHNGASAFELVVADPLLKWADDPTFTDCKEVEIELGLPGRMNKVFEGEVTAWRHELERNGPTVLVLRGLDRSHRLMRGQKTRTYANATPLDCARKIAQEAGLTAKCNGGQPQPVQMFRMQANESDFSFLRKMADLEGYLFYIEGQELHFERPTLSSSDDVEVSYGADLKTFLPVANFRKPAVDVEVGAWDDASKAELTGRAAVGDELWAVPGVKPGATLAKFQSTKPRIALVEAEVRTQEHAETIARAALTRRNLEFLTAEVEVKGNPEIKPGSMVNVKNVGVYSGLYWVTEANHFWDASGYSTIFYVARDKWGDSSNAKAKEQAARQPRSPEEPKQQPLPQEGVRRLPDITFWYEIDIHAPGAKDDTLTLETQDGSWRHRVAVKGLSEVEPGWVELVFPNPPAGARFDLIQDPGDGHPPFHVFQGASYRELQRELGDEESDGAA